MNIKHDEAVGIIAHTLINKYYSFYPLYPEDVPIAVGNMAFIHGNILQAVAYNVVVKKKAPTWLSRYFGAVERWDSGRVGYYGEGLTLKGQIMATMVAAIYLYLKEQKDAQLSLPF